MFKKSQASPTNKKLKLRLCYEFYIERYCVPHPHFETILYIIMVTYEKISISFFSFKLINIILRVRVLLINSKYLNHYLSK